MTSDAQHAANRRNAQKSTGPKTADGKERARMNALKHGAYLKHNDHVSATMLREDEDAIEELREAIVADLDPYTVVEAMQARAIAQKMLNQYRIDRLGPHLANDQQLPPIDGPTPDELEQAAEFLWQVVHTISFRDQPAEPTMCYETIAKGFHEAHKQRLGPLPPAIDPDVVGVDAWRDQLCAMVDRVYPSHDEARHKIMTLHQRRLVGADQLRREIAGSEARRLIDAFSKVTDLQDRVGRMIARDLKAYRDFQASRPRPDSDREDSRNEPNPIM